MDTRALSNFATKQNSERSERMSTSPLYHGFGLKNHQYLRSEYVKGQIFFTVKQDRWSLRCPVCNGKKLRLHGSRLRQWFSLPIGSKPTFVKMAVPRVECTRCAITRRVNVPFADRRRTYTSAFERYTLELLRGTKPTRHRESMMVVFNGIQQNPCRVS